LEIGLGHPIFTVDGWYQLILTAFDMAMTFLTLKVGVGLRKIDFWVFQKMNQTSVT